MISGCLVFLFRLDCVGRAAKLYWSINMFTAVSTCAQPITAYPLHIYQNPVTWQYYAIITIDDRTGPPQRFARTSP